MGAGAKTQVVKWGHSLAVRIPRTVAQTARLREGDRLSINAGRDGAITIRLARPKYRLADLLAKITPANRHRETDWGKPLGREVW